MVSRDLLRSTVTNRIAFDQREVGFYIRTRDESLLPGDGFQTGNLTAHHFYLTDMNY